MRPQSVPEVPADQVPDDAVLLDVREDDEWAAGHAPQAVHVPMNDVPARLDQISSAAGDERLHVICRSGGRSAQVTAYLAQAGWKAVNVDGGMKAWAASARPMVAEASGEPRVI
ncbi:MAG: rhodanese-like domain-containing protein [Pseudonocardiaceae bacterium]|nr:rhodanese-like domain-containing protein [Pseudonocardiaceae bacterium]